MRTTTVSMNSCCPLFVTLSQEERKFHNRCSGSTRVKWRLFYVERAASVRLSRLQHLARCRVCFEVVVAPRRVAA